MDLTSNSQINDSKQLLDDSSLNTTNAESDKTDSIKIYNIVKENNEKWKQKNIKLKNDIKQLINRIEILNGNCAKNFYKNCCKFSKSK